MTRSNSKRLLVEGAKDRRLFPYLMEANGVSWPKGNEPVEIKDLGGNLLAKYEASAEIKEPGLQRLGIVLDADDNVAGSWQSIKEWFGEWFPDMPEEIPFEGYVSTPNERGIRLGAWIMPDNQSEGMLETFLKLLVKESDKTLFAFVEKTCLEAKSSYNAGFKDVHFDKARIHTYLSWQDEPGRQLHEAIAHGVLDPVSSHSQPIVRWFRTLFEI
jgi:hypothetical protein